MSQNGPTESTDSTASPDALNTNLQAMRDRGEITELELQQALGQVSTGSAISTEDAQATVDQINTTDAGNAASDLGLTPAGQISTSGTLTDPGDELAGFNPDQNLTDVTQDGIADLEGAARGNTLRDLTDLLGAEFDDLGPLLAAEAERRGEAELSGDAFADILRQSLSSSSEATPEQLDRINTIAESNIQRSASDIDSSLQRGLEQLRDESGASRGLRFTDTPIFDGAQESVNEAQRLQAQSINSARGAQAQAELDLPMAMQQLEFQRAGMAQNARNFEAQLAQQAFGNRSMLFGNSQGFGLDLLGASPSATESQAGLRDFMQDKKDARRARQSAQDDRRLGTVTAVAGLFG